MSELSNFIATDRFLNLFKQSVDANIAQVIARNAARPATLSGVDEKQVFFKMDDEIINWIKSKPQDYNINPDTISRVSELDSNLLPIPDLEENILLVLIKQAVFMEQCLVMLFQELCLII